MDEVHYSSAKTTGKDNWETPADLYSFLNFKFGPFILDPAASSENHKCPLFFTEEDDALTKDWTSDAFLNPPYSKLKAFCAKAFGESQKHGIRVCLLTPARTDTKAFHDYLKHGTLIFVKGRIKFVGASAGAPFPSLVTIFGAEKKEVLFLEKIQGEYKIKPYD